MFLGDYFTTDVKPQLWGDISLIATIKKKKKKKKTNCSERIQATTCLILLAVESN